MCDGTCQLHFGIEIKGDINQCHVLKRDIVPQTKPLLAGIPPMLAGYPGPYRDVLGESFLLKQRQGDI